MSIYAGRARVVQWSITRIMKLQDDIEKNRDRLIEVVNIANTFLLPRAWIGLDDRGDVHMTYVQLERPRGQLNVTAHAASYVWCYVPWDEMVICKKSRDDRYVVGQSYPVQPTTVE